VIYIIASTTVQILIPADELAKSNAPFEDVARLFFGEAAGHWLALFAAISGFGALNGWILLQGELPLQLARDGVFPRYFARESRYHTPARALIVSSVLVTALMLFNYDKSMVQVFNFVILIASFSTLVLYLTCSVAALKLLHDGKLQVARGRTAALAICGLLGGGYALWAIIGAGISTDAEQCKGALLCWATWSKNPSISGRRYCTGRAVYFGMRWRAGRRLRPKAAERGTSVCPTRITKLSSPSHCMTRRCPSPPRPGGPDSSSAPDCRHRPRAREPRGVESDQCISGCRRRHRQQSCVHSERGARSSAADQACACRRCARARG
jgi:amino acid transporter